MPSQSQPSARSIHITGHVQGVFFREWTVALANGLGVSGWVRNRRDGSIEIYAAGEADPLERFTAQLRLGSPASRVDAVRVEPAELTEGTGFMRRGTL